MVYYYHYIAAINALRPPGVCFLNSAILWSADVFGVDLLQRHSRNGPTVHRTEAAAAAEVGSLHVAPCGLGACEPITRP